MTRENDLIANRLGAAPESGAGDGVELGDLFDSRMLQSMLDDFYALTHVPMALIGVDGAVFVGAGWQDVCTKFHRVNPDSCAHCVESDTVLTADIPTGEARLYKCKNGMWDAATPILVGDSRVANLFTGQFFFDDEPVDREFFRAQAERYGFDVDEYLAAIDRVPRLSHDTVDMGLRFLTNLSNMISQLSFSNIERSRAEARLQEALGAQTGLTERLGSERAVLQAMMENTDTHLAYLDPDFNFVLVNSTYARGSGHSMSELIGSNHFDLFPNAENQAIFEHARETGEAVEYREKPFEFADQPWRGVTYWDWRLTPVKDPDGRLNGLAFSLQDVTRNVRERAFSNAINRLNETIHSDLDFDAILEQFVPELAAVTFSEVVTVMLRGEDGRWRFREVFGLPAEVKDRTFGDDQVPASVEALETGRPAYFGVGDRPTPGLAKTLGIRSLLVAPLSVAGKDLGVVSYGYLSGPGEFDDNAIDFAGKIAASLSLALQNSRLFEAERAAARLNEALTSIDHSIHGTLELDEMLRRVVVEAAEALGCESSALDMREQDRWVVRYVHRFPEESVGSAFTDAEVPFAAMAADARQPVVIDDAFEDPRVDRHVQRTYNVRSVMAAPLVVQDETLGVLFFNYHERSHSFTPQEVTFAERLSASLSLAIANARLYETEHRIADRLQGALLALPQHVDGVEFAHSYHAALEVARVGGDFYDVFELDEHHVGITIGDVAGKGLDAAVLTSMVKNTIRAHAHERGKTPSQILQLTNDVVFKATATDAFVTVFFGVLDRRDGRVVYANAGHTTPALLTANGEVGRLPATGPLLGAFHDVRFGEAETRIRLGELLFLYTDGLSEARRDGQLYGEERLFDLLASMSPRSATEVVEAVTADVVSFSESRLRDDLAILAVRRLG